MANHISHASLPYPIKNARFTVLAPFLDADGDPTDPTATLDSEISQDNGAFADAAEELTVASGSRGMAMLTITGAEMNNSAVSAYLGCATAKATLLTLYPRNLPILESGTAGAGAAGSLTLAAGTYTGLNLAGCFLRTTGGTGGGGSGGANNQARRITSYNTSTRVATVTPNWETTPDGTTTYDILLPEGVLVPMLTALAPSTLARTLQVESDGMAYADAREWLGGTIATPSVTGVPEVDVTHFNGTAGTFSSGRPEVNTSHLGGSSQSLLDLKDFADDGYDPSTNKVQGVVLVDTLTTYTGNTPQTGDAFARIGANGAGLSAVPWNASWDAEVQSEVADALDAAVPGSPTANSINERIKTMDDADIPGRLPAALVSGRMDSSVGAMAANVITAAATAADFGTEIAAAVWDALTSGMSTVGSIGKKLADWSIHSAADVWAVATRRLTDATNITSTGGTTVPQTGDSYAIVNSGTHGNAALKVLIDAIDDLLDTEIAAIKAKTDNLPADPADASDVAAALTALQAAILAKLPAALTAGGNMKSDMLAANGSASAAARHALSAEQIIPGTIDTAGFTPTTTEFEADDITEATADHYNGCVVIWTSGALAGQRTEVSDYSISGGRGHFTVVAMTEAPANNDTFILV